MSDYRKRVPGQMVACFQEIVGLYDAGKIKPAPTRILPIAQFATAPGDIGDRRARGRVGLSHGKDQR